MPRLGSLTRERLMDVLDYDPTIGKFFWKVPLASNTKVGSLAGKVNPKGYRYITIDGHEYLAQRLAWFWVHGVWPKMARFQNEDKLDFRIDNLREGFRLDRKFNHKDPVERAAYQKAHRAARPDYHRASHLKKKFGISTAEYTEMLEGQSGLCAICGKPESIVRGARTAMLAVDHDHATGAIRELLCNTCNGLIGFCNDDPTVLEAALRYLRKHASGQKVVTLHTG